jgi:MscS family membrane protein
MMRKTLFLLRFSLFLLLIPAGLTAQSQASPDLRTPYQTVYTHLHYLQSDSYQPERSAAVMQGVTDADEAQSLAIKLKQILDGKGLFVEMDRLPRVPNYRDTLSGKAEYVLFPHELPEVYLEKVGDNWYYSSSTIEQIPDLHKKVYPFGTDLLVNIVPKYGQEKFLGLAVWQYVGFLILIAVSWIIHFFLSRLLRPVVNRLSRSRIYPATVPAKLIFSIARLTSIWLIILAWIWIVPLIQLPIHWVEFIMAGIRIAATVLFLVLGLRILDVIILYAKKWAAGTNTQLDNQLVPILKRMLQLVLILGAFIQVLRLLDVNVTALIAGVSIGGLALALAAQDTVKNLIGSAMIFFDRPFQINDWIIGDTFEGKVVEVGFRSTRIQLLDSSVVAVPNGTISNASVRNLGVRTMRLLDARLGILYSTPPHKIEWFMQGLKELILAHPRTIKEGYRVHLVEMADFSINIMYRTFIQTDDYGEELQIKEELFLGAIRLAELLGIDFAFPTSTIHVDSFPGQAPAPEKPGPASREEMGEQLSAFIEKYKKDMEPLPPDPAL